MKTPAVTMVAAWIRAETGVGPSIASGSQVCSGNCADLPIAPMKSSRQASVIACHVDGRGSGQRLAGESPDAAAKIWSKSTEPNSDEDGEDAEREAEIADAVDDEGLDRRGVGRGLADTRSRSADSDARPTPSQPKNICTRLSAVTSISMAKVNSDR